MVVVDEEPLFASEEGETAGLLMGWRRFSKRPRRVWRGGWDVVVVVVVVAGTISDCDCCCCDCCCCCC